MEKLPIYKMVVKDDDSSGFDFVALVDDPAIMVEWLSFSEDKKKYKFKEDAKRRILTGPLMIPNLPIYRVDKQGRAFYVQFDGETNEVMMKKFMKNGFTQNINMMHDPKQKVSGAYFMEVWMSDESRGVYAPEGFKDLPDKTIYGSVYFENEELYNEAVATGKVRGFSIEGLFGELIMDYKPEKDLISQIEAILSDNVQK